MLLLFLNNLFNPLFQNFPQVIIIASVMISIRTAARIFLAALFFFLRRTGLETSTLLIVMEGKNRMHGYVLILPLLGRNPHIDNVRHIGLPLRDKGF